MNTIKRGAINKNISKKPLCNCLKFTAHGYMKITSTSNITKRIAVKKYLILNGSRALPTLSIPHSNEDNFAFVLLFGPRKCVDTITIKTNPAATRNWINIAI